MNPITKITDAVLVLLGEQHELKAEAIAARINNEERFSAIRAKWPRHPIKVDQVYAAMSGLRSKSAVARTFIEPVSGGPGSHKAYRLTQFGRVKLAQLHKTLGYGSTFVKADNKAEAVDHPAHYGGEENPYEAIKVIEAWDLDFCLGNTVKYISRAGRKDPAKELEDLKKARWYLNRRIEQLENASA